MAIPWCPARPGCKPRYNDLDTGQITGGIYYWYDGTSEKTAASFKVSHFADNFIGGSHDFKFGVQYNTGGHDYLTGYNDYIYTYSGTPGYGYTQLPFHIGGHMRRPRPLRRRHLPGLEPPDHQRGPALRQQRGELRRPSTSLDKLGNPTGQTSPERSDLFTWNTLSPRIGFYYKLTSGREDGLEGPLRPLLQRHHHR